jgi:hypothetical protein
MIGYHRPWGIEDLLVHFNAYPLIANARISAGIVSVCASDDVPFVFAQAVVVFGIDDGVFALSEWDAAERVAEADAAVYECKPNERPYEPVRDVEVNPDRLFPPGERRISNFKSRIPNYALPL